MRRRWIDRAAGLLGTSETPVQNNQGNIRGRVYRAEPI
jgi:hypothetical protein